MSEFYTLITIVVTFAAGVCAGRYLFVQSSLRELRQMREELEENGRMLDEIIGLRREVASLRRE